MQLISLIVDLVSVATWRAAEAQLTAGVWGKVLGPALMGTVPESVISMVSLRGWVSSVRLLPLGVIRLVCSAADALCTQCPVCAWGWLLGMTNWTCVRTTACGLMSLTTAAVAAAGTLPPVFDSFAAVVSADHYVNCTHSRDCAHACSVVGLCAIGY